MVIKIKEVDGNRKFLMGRKLANENRLRLDLDNLDKSSERVRIIISDDFKSLNSSYFLGLFGESIRTLGKEKFIEKYKFECKETFKKSIKKYITLLENKKGDDKNGKWNK